MARTVRLAGYRSEDIDDGDPAILCTAEPAPERVTFRVQQGALQMSIQCRGAGHSETGNPWHELLDDLTNTTIFRYFDEDGVEMLPGNVGLTPAERARVNLTSRAYLRSRPVVP